MTPRARHSYRKESYMNFIKTVIAVLVAQLLLGMTLFFGLLLVTALFTTDEGVTVEDGSWLVLDVYGEIPSYDPPESIASSIIFWCWRGSDHFARPFSGSASMGSK